MNTRAFSKKSSKKMYFRLLRAIGEKYFENDTPIETPDGKITETVSACFI
jgi:hypothetical protein